MAVLCIVADQLAALMAGKETEGDQSAPAAQPSHRSHQTARNTLT